VLDAVGEEIDQRQAPAALGIFVGHPDLAMGGHRRITGVGGLDDHPTGLNPYGEFAEHLAVRVVLNDVGHEFADNRGHHHSLAALDVRREAWSAPNRLQYLRRAWDGGDVYFIKNASSEPIDERIKLATDFAAALFMDPITGAIGPADIDTQQGGLRLQLDPGQTLSVKTYRNAFNYSGPGWPYTTPAGSPSEIEGEWSVDFIAGGPELPPPFKTRLLTSWTDLAGAAGESFAGTARYTIRFAPDIEASRYLLDLGHVADSARVSLNGKPIATLFAPPFRVEISPRMSDNNTLTIEVTNVAANRIRDLDRRGVKWRIFKDINLVGIDYKPFDAAQWPVRPAGLLGPVTITPLAD